MKGPVLAAWIAAGFVLASSGAQAEPADCDLVCRLQGYLSTDHMAGAPATATAPSAATPAKHHSHAAGAVPKVPVAGTKPPSRSVPAVAAEAVPKLPVKSAAKASASNKMRPEEAMAAKPDAPKAAAAPAPHTARVPAVAATLPRLPVRDAKLTKPPKNNAAVSVMSAAGPAEPPETVTTPKRPRRIARAVPRFTTRGTPQPVATADLIPGSARLMPADFQPFGNL